MDLTKTLSRRYNNGSFKVNALKEGVLPSFHESGLPSWHQSYGEVFFFDFRVLLWGYNF